MAPKWTAKKNNLPTDVPDRKMFPLYWSPDRHGNEYPPIRGTPDCGPGHYDTYLTNSLIDNLERKPESKMGYTLGARTSVRFLPKLTISPGPAVYQRRLGRERTFKPSSAPFGSSTPRSRESSLNKLVVPGPGTYHPNEQRNQHVTWPMKFGAPDWNLVPAPKKRTLRIELASDKEFRKHRNRVAYFSLYFS
ncbi:ciliary microtubule-associated protein 3-like isoform X1 [Chiloscyllium punctatum]|uniref:ciliary microtubule-associated protein 3-like isoform X1 n=2 Tax=Chiloscyllium punctatum TaxID=137246 RepID=UPI003B63652E